MPGQEETHSTESQRNEPTRSEEEARVGELFPTYQVAKAYLRSLHVAMWGRVYYVHEDVDDAAAFLTKGADAVNAIRNLALEHGVGLDDAARQYHQLSNPTITKGLR